MFLLFFGLGTANLKAQVRIGGNTAPNAAAALDLNATDATNNGTKGLALPRVNLTSNTMQLTTGVVNLTGMLVYNTTATLGQIGIFYWNGATWVKASLPSTSAADSGKFLMSNGVTFVLTNLYASSSFADTISVNGRALGSVSWTKVLDTTVNVTTQSWRVTSFPQTALNSSDICHDVNLVVQSVWVWPNGRMYIQQAQQQPITGAAHIKCYRPSI